MSAPVDPGSMIEIQSGVSAFSGKGFCTVFVNGVPTGQMTPTDVRTMALNWLSAAEAAEHDAATVAELRRIGVEEQSVAQFLQVLREHRDGAA